MQFSLKSRLRCLRIAACIFASVELADSREVFAQSDLPVLRRSESTADTEQRRADVLRYLDGNSDWEFQGHPISYYHFIAMLLAEEQIRISVDSVRLARLGTSLEKIDVLPICTAGISRRSSLRLILSAGGLGYVIDDQANIVVTDEQMAGRYWSLADLTLQTETWPTGDIATRRDQLFLAGFGPVFKDNLGLLITLLNDADDTVAFDAAFAIGRYGSSGESAVEPLMKLLSSNNKARHSAAVFALGRIGPPAIPPLMEVALWDNEFHANGALRALAQMGICGKPAFTDLLEAGKTIASSEQNAEWLSPRSQEVASALASISGDNEVVKIADLLDDDSAHFRSLAALVLGELEVRAIDSTPKLTALLSDKNEGVRMSAAYALTRIPLPSDMNLAPIKAATMDSNREVRLWSESILRDFAKMHSR